MMEILKHGSHVEELEPVWLRKKVVNEVNITVINAWSHLFEGKMGHLRTAAEENSTHV